MPAEERLHRQANTVCAARLYKGDKIQEGQARYPGKDEISSITRKYEIFTGSLGHLHKKIILYINFFKSLSIYKY